MQKGFTLIELLVVVLIIGILAAVALPNYEMAVMKARYANLTAVLGTFRDAEEIYYLANGSYVDDTTALDVGDLGGCSASGSGYLRCEQFDIDVNAGWANNNPAGYMKDKLNAYVYYQNRSPVKPGVRECWAAAGNEKANRLCRSLGGTESGSKSDVGAIEGGAVTIYELK